MAADIVFHDDRVEVSDGSLVVEKNLTVKRGVLNTRKINTGLIAGPMYRLRGSTLELGTTGQTSGSLTIHGRPEGSKTRIAGQQVQTNRLDIGKVAGASAANGILNVFNINGNSTISLKGSAGRIDAVTVRAKGLFETSDGRMKANVRRLPSSSLDRVLALRGVTFKWRTDPRDAPTDTHDDRAHIGLISQEVAEVVPEAVVENDDGLQSLSYGSLVPLLIEAIKAQQGLIKQLQSRVADLEGTTA